MRKIKKIILYSTIIFFIIIGLLIAIPFLFKGKIIALLKEEINKNIVHAKVDFSAMDLSLISSFPDFRLGIKDLHIQNDSTFDNKDLFYTKNINIDINLLSVIKGEQYTINNISIASPRLNALVLPNGKANYDIMKNDTTHTEKEKKNEDTTASHFNLRLQSFTIKDANIFYEDKKGDNTYKFSTLNYTLKGDMTHEETDLAMKLGIDTASVLHSGIAYLNKTNLDLDINIGTQFKTQKYTIKKNTLRINALELQLQGWVQVLKNAFDMDISLNIAEISLKNLLSLIPALYTKDFKDIIAQGQTSLRAQAKGIYDSTRMPAFNVTLQVDNGHVKYPGLPKNIENIEIALNISNKDGILDHTAINLDKLHANLGENRADASIHILHPVSNPNISAIIKAKADLSTLKDYVLAKDLNLHLEGLLDANIELAGTKSMIDKKQYKKFKAAGNITVQIKNGSFKYQNLPKTAENIQIALNILNKDGILDHTAINLDKFHITLGKNQAEASLHILHPISDPNISAIIKTKADLSTLKEFIPIKNLNLEGLLDADIELAGTKSMVDKKQYKKFKATGNLTLNKIKYISPAFKNPILVKGISLFLSPQKVQLNNLEAKFGKSDIQMKGIVTNFLDYFIGGKKELAGNFSLTSNTLDLNEFITQDTTKKDKAGSTTVSSSRSATPSVLEIPGNIDFTLHTNITHTHYDIWNIEQLNGTVKIKNKQATLSDLKFSLLDASFLINGSYITDNLKKPKVIFNTKINNLDIQKALTRFPIASKFTPLTKECYGNINCNIAFNTLLSDTMSPILSTLNANGTIQTKSVQLKGNLTNQFTALFHNKDLANMSLKDLSLTFNITNGVLALNPFPLRFGLVQGNCQAKYDLEGQMDMRYNAQIPTELIQDLLTREFPEIIQIQQKAKENGFDNLVPTHIGIIINVTGPVNKPKFGMTLDKNFGITLKNNIETAVKKKLEQTKNHLIRKGQKEMEKQSQKLLEEGKKKLRDILKF